MADLYKETLRIDLAFALTRDMAGRYDKHKVSDAFRQRVIRMDLLAKLADDIPNVLGVNNHARSRRQ
jgi:CRISPR-associated protein Cas1